MKKVLAMLLVLVMVIGMMPLNVFAAETAPTITLTPSTTDLHVGDTFTVSVDLTGNPGIGSFQLQLLWNADVVSIESFDYSNTVMKAPTVNPPKGAFVWYANTNMTDDGNLFVATFKVVGTGDCQIRQNADYFYATDDKAAQITFTFDETQVSGLAAVCAHDWAEATCTAAKVCTLCGATEGDALGHSYEAVVTAPTCTEGGYTTYTCSVCGDSYTADETEATGHTAVGGVCTVCGEKIQSVVYAWYGDGSAAQYTISTAEELHQFAAIVNGTDANYAQDDFSGKTVSLANDIALAADGLYIVNEDVAYGTSSWPLTIDQFVLKAEAPVWTPIGAGTSSGNGVVVSTSFAGTFDGKGHTISGIYTGTKDATTCNTLGVQGLFGVVSGTVKNLTVSGCITGTTVIGGVVAYLNGGTVENCVNNALVFGDGGNKPATGREEGLSRAGAVGGIVGRAAGTGSVSDCVNNGHIVCANSNKGGRVAGIIGLIDATGDAVPTSRNVNNGTIEGYQYVAGIVGMVYSTKSPTDSCINNGDIYGYGTNKTHIGGIVGQYSSVISNCYNTGNITVPTGANAYGSHIGGDYGAANPTIINCYTIGNFYGNQGGRHYGIFSGCGKSSNCYYLDTAAVATTSEEQGTLTAKTADELKTADMVAALNGEGGTAWKMDGTCVSINGGYPILTWQTGESDHSMADATCTEQGYTIRKCTDCGHTYNVDFVPALGHSFTEYVSDDNATCTEDGTMTAVCDRDGCDATDTVAIEGTAFGHTWVGGVCVTCGLVNENAEKYPWYEAGAETGSYSIATAVELAQLAAIVNGTDANYPQDNFSGKTVSLANDIALAADGLYTATENVTYGTKSYPLTTTQYVLKEEAPVWTPIGLGTATTSYNNVTTKSAFAGTFDGQGHTISGVYTGTKDAANPNTESVQGLFGIVTGTVKNLTVSGCVTGRSVVGGVVAYLNGGTIENCVNNAIVFSDGGNRVGKETGGSGAGATGGIVGRAGGTASVTGCVNNATVICANSNKGGRVAGIIGLIDASGDVVTIERNANYGTIVGYQYVAGIVGMNYSSKSPITSCLNAGEIHAWGAQKIHVGGIVGQFNSPVSDCYSLADIHLYWTQKSQYVGGIAGDRTTYSGTAGNALTVNNCYFTGSIIYATKDTIGSISMIAGDVSSKSVNNYYLDTGFAGSSTQCGAVSTSYATSKTAEELKTAAMVALLNGEGGTAWKMDGTCKQINNGYPILVWQTGAADHEWTDATCTAPATCAVCGATEGEALGHSYESVVTEPTCTEQGYTTHTCAVCGDSYVDTYVDALGHSYESAVTKEATCEEDGVLTYTCAACGDAYTEAIPATGHTAGEAVTENEVAATCTTDGSYDTVVYCTVCGTEVSRETTTIPATGHSYESVVTEPTCTEQGYTTHTCAVCGDSYVDTYVDALGHSYESVVTEPTCTEQGYTTHTCAVCGDSYVDTYVDALGHSYESVVTKEATCEEDGELTSTCAVCGDAYTEVIPATGHTAGEAVTENEVAATCTTDGSYDTVVYCTVCGTEVSRETTVVPATGHSYESVVTEPTCTEQGCTTHTCTACGDSYVDTYVDALGHDYKNGVCAHCGAEDPDYVEPTKPGSDNNGPQTGDSAQMTLWTGLTVMALLGVAVLFTTRKKWMSI